MRDTTGQVTSRTVGYKRISSILPMQPNRLCIWSLVACGAMFVTWTTLDDMIVKKIDGFFSVLFVSVEADKSILKTIEIHTNRIELTNATHQMNRNDSRPKSIYWFAQNFNWFSRLPPFFFFSFCFKNVRNARQCTPFLKQRKEVSVTANRMNRIIWHTTTLILSAARCQSP